jgi:ABC-2 type transport system ATP-binding protein
VIEASGLSKRYGDLVAVDAVSFSVQPGEVVGFLGPNGAGKTTTMRMLTGFLPPTDGRAVIDGHDIFSDPLAARRAIGYLPETPPLYPEMSVEGYLAYVAKLKDVPRSGRSRAVDSALDRCGLGDVRRRVIGALAAEGSARTVILSTHILPEVEAICRRVIIMNRGRKVVDAPLDEVRQTGSLEEVFARATAREFLPEEVAS